MARTIKENKNVIQSYIFTVAKYDYSVHEKRILYRLVEFAQDELKGVMIRDNLRKIERNIFGRTFTMPVSDILKNETDKNYSIAKKAFTDLQKKLIIFENGKTFTSIPPLLKVQIEKSTGMVSFNVDNDVWNCILDFSKGYKKYELITAMNFRSAYTMRFYELMSEQKRPISYTLETLREMFGVQNKYQRVNDFIRFVIEPAKKELDEHSPYTFNYRIDKIARKVIGFTFYPIHLINKEDEDTYEKTLISKLSTSALLSREIIDYLSFSFEFTKEEINKNKQTFVKGANTIPDFMGLLSELVGRSRTAKSRIGYVVNAIKKQIEEHK